jgi:hypothetical protein
MTADILTRQKRRVVPCGTLDGEKLRRWPEDRGGEKHGVQLQKKKTTHKLKKPLTGRQIGHKSLREVPLSGIVLAPPLVDDSPSTSAPNLSDGPLWPCVYEFHLIGTIKAIVTDFSAADTSINQTWQPTVPVISSVLVSIPKARCHGDKHCYLVLTNVLL